MSCSVCMSIRAGISLTCSHSRQMICLHIVHTTAERDHEVCSRRASRAACFLLWVAVIACFCLLQAFTTHLLVFLLVSALCQTCSSIQIICRDNLSFKLPNFTNRRGSHAWMVPPFVWRVCKNHTSGTNPELVPRVRLGFIHSG